MQTKPAVFSSAFLAFSLLLAMPAQAFDMGNMMNPSKWVGGNKDRDRYDDDYYDYGPPPGYGYGGYGVPGYGGDPALQGLQAYDYGTTGAPATGSGYTGPSYGGNYTGPSDASRSGGQSGYGPGITTDDQMEIQRLKDRIRKLEQAEKPQPNVWGN